MQLSDYCRQIETYLCQKNDGHLVRVVGPSFDIVSGWAERGVPLKVALQGIDRYFERYYRKGPRRRPVKIDFCDADVLDVFDEWRKAIGQSSVDRHQLPVADGQSSIRTHPSLPAHLERVVMRLTAARVRGALGPAFDELIDRVARELDAARAKAGGLRGDARRDRAGGRRGARCIPRRDDGGGVRPRARGGDGAPRSRALRPADDCLPVMKGPC